MDQKEFFANPDLCTEEVLGQIIRLHRKAYGDTSVKGFLNYRELEEAKNHGCDIDRPTGKEATDADIIKLYASGARNLKKLSTAISETRFTNEIPNLDFVLSAYIQSYDDIIFDDTTSIKRRSVSIFIDVLFKEVLRLRTEIKELKEKAK